MRGEGPQRMQSVISKTKASGKSKQAVSRGQHQPPDKAHTKPKGFCNKRSACNVHKNNRDSREDLLSSFWSPTHLAPAPPAKTRKGRASHVAQQNPRVKGWSLPLGNSARQSTRQFLDSFGSEASDADSEDVGEASDSDSEDVKPDGAHGCNGVPKGRATLSMVLDEALRQREAGRHVQQVDQACKGADPCDEEGEAQGLASSKNGEWPASGLALVSQALRDCEEGPVVPREQQCVVGDSRSELAFMLQALSNCQGGPTVAGGQQWVVEDSGPPSLVLSEECDDENAEIELPDWYNSLLRDEADKEWDVQCAWEDLPIAAAAAAAWSDNKDIVFLSEAAMYAHVDVYADGEEIDANDDLELEIELAATCGYHEHEDPQAVVNDAGGEAESDPHVDDVSAPIKKLIRASHLEAAPTNVVVTRSRELTGIQDVLGYPDVRIHARVDHFSVVRNDQIEAGGLDVDLVRADADYKPEEVNDARIAVGYPFMYAWTDGAAAMKADRDFEALQLGFLEPADVKVDCTAGKGADGDTKVTSEDDADARSSAVYSNNKPVLASQAHCLVREAKPEASDNKVIGIAYDVLCNALNDVLKLGSSYDDSVVGQRFGAFKAECEVLKEAIKAGEMETLKTETPLLDPKHANLLDCAAESDSDDESWLGVEHSEDDGGSEGNWEDEWCLVDETTY